MRASLVMLLKPSLLAQYTVLVFMLSFTLVMTKISHPTAQARQEHLLRTLPYYEIDYPTQVSQTGRHIRHVTSNPRRTRRSAHHTDGHPVYYSVRFGGSIYRMKLHVNDKLFGAGIVVERHKKGGKVETTTAVENCYLVGEVQGSLHTAAISDCEGLSGVIDIGDDVIFIEPMINETSYPGFAGNATSKPHLLYRKSSLHKADGVTIDLADDHWSAAAAHAQGIKLDYQAANSYIQVVNRAKRPVKLLYLNGKKEMLFKTFGPDEDQNINTYTSHRWLVRDAASNKRLLIGKTKVYMPPINTETNRTEVFITVPKGLELPEYKMPDPPDSHLKFVNQAGRFVQLYYVTPNNKRKLFGAMAPGETTLMNTYTGHKWYAEDYDTDIPLWINTQPSYVAATSSVNRRLVAIVSIPANVFLSREEYPKFLDIPPKFVEVLVAADPTVVKHHGKDKVERYVLTLMNIVSQIFQHKSIGIKIYFVVVRVILLEEEPKHVKITTSPMDSLMRVCYWGHKQRRGWDKTSKEFYDQTVYLTKQNFGPSGYAPVSSMCYRTRSCTLNDDDGFPSAFIVAHETGHTLGMEHDGDLNNCSKDVIKGSIMAPLVRSRFDRFYWSACSRRELIAFLDHLWCLDDVPFNLNSSLSKPLPGQIYGRDEQCAKDMGIKFKACKEYEYTANPCRQLWCDDKSNNDERSYCRSRRTPPLEGTTCGDNKWCRLGYCVPIRKDGTFEIPTRKPQPKPIHGNWTEWTKFGPCSLSCGSGVKIRARSCTNPSPRYFGRTCVGSTYDIALCRNKPCVGVPPSFTGVRDQLCRSKSFSGYKDWGLYNIHQEDLNCDFENDLCLWTNEKNGRDDDFDWAHHTGRTPSSGTGPLFDHTKGENGTGRYLFIETSRPTDVGWRARLISRTVAKHVTCLSFWYHAYGDDDHFGTLQLFLNTTGREKLIWTVNRNLGKKWKHKMVTILSIMPYRIVIQGTRGDGYRSDIAIDDITFTSGACKTSKKPSSRENRIPMPVCHTFCESKSANAVYKIRVKDGTGCYENPAINDVCVKGKCLPVGCDGKFGSLKVYDNCGICDGNNDTCTVSSGVITTLSDEDEEETILECPVGATNILVEEFNGSPNFLTVQINGAMNETLINGNENGSTPGIYEIAGTKLLYSKEAGSEKILALGPIKEPIVVKAKKQKGPVNTSPILIKYKYYRPNKEPTIYYWKPLGWSTCTRPCGRGRQKRLYDCYRKNDQTKVKHKLCYGISRPRPWKQSCNIDECEVRHYWKLGSWSPCSVTCNDGFKSRDVKCIATMYGKPNTTVADENCEDKKPLTITKCVRKECVATWKAGPWSLCSKTCGQGLRTRSVKCVDKNGKTSNKCSEKSRLGSSSYCTLTKCVNNVPVVLGNLSCTFEAGFCKWRNVRKDDQFNWMLRTGHTPSRYTGPSYDHTFRTNRKFKGKYIYCEASAPHKQNERARLYSPLIEISKICLDFWYHMLGDKMGTLNVYTTTGKGLTRLWTKSGNQGGRWQNRMIQISSASAYKIVIEGVRGPGYSSDLAVDDITIYSGACPKSKYFRPECTGDKSRYCRLAARYGWCSASVWGSRLCCRTCASVAVYRQHRTS